MKAYFLFTAMGPVVVLTSFDSITNSGPLSRLASKGIDKFVAYEIPINTAKEKYGHHFDLVCQDLHETDDLRVLDYNGIRAMELFSFSELHAPIYQDPKVPV